ncbi:MAG: hypothetical protein IKZ89_02530 [Bacteroidaceae bacterium]|nr:hypothetical protein [Bacteroidaceae bacterium]
MRERVRDKGRLLDIIEHAKNVTMLIEGYSIDDITDITGLASTEIAKL